MSPVSLVLCTIVTWVDLKDRIGIKNLQSIAWDIFNVNYLRQAMLLLLGLLGGANSTIGQFNIYFNNLLRS